MSNTAADVVAEDLLATIDIPESAYEKAKNRYLDLGSWFGRVESRCHPYRPHIYPQGSFRLGTVIRPISDRGEYDIDVGCRLQTGIAKATHTQKELKDLVGADLADYRVARRIAERLEPMHRCWRLKYADELTFHIDTVPSIPETPASRQLIREGMVRAGLLEALAQQVSEHAGAITDDRLRNYQVLSPDWRVSNSEGYALWFESRMKLAAGLLTERVAAAKLARIDQLPTYKWKSPLQACVQVLKRHRDVMFETAPKSAPISIIITTLAGRAYRGETDVVSALRQVLATMGNYVLPTSPRIANPVNPVEDFADKWAEPSCQHLRLEENFWAWLRAASRDFDAITSAQNVSTIVELAQRGYGSRVDAAGLTKRIGVGSSLLSQPAVPGGLSFPPTPVVPSKPAGFA